MSKAEKKITNYVLGFMFGLNMATLILIKKSHPEFMKDKINGVGGVVAQGESLDEAMVRTFEKETGIKTTVGDWEPFGELKSHDYNVTCFVSVQDSIFDLFKPPVIMGQEVPAIYLTDFILRSPELYPDLKWLIPFAMENKRGALEVVYP